MSIRSTRTCTRNRRRNRPITPPTQPPRVTDFTPKETYKTKTTETDLLIVSKRKRAFLTDEEKADAVAAKQRRTLETKKKKLGVLLLRHKVAALWEHGCCMDGWHFAAKNCKKIIEFMQSTYPQYTQFAAARSFVYRTVKRHKVALASGEDLTLDAMRDRRGENRQSTKRKNARTVQLCDELLGGLKATAPKVRRALADQGVFVSTKTIHRIARDLHFRWTKPWHTDVLTPAQQKKREIFCRNLLTLSDPELLNLIASWLFTDEKWWDIVGPASAAWCKGESKTEAKQKNQVLYVCFAMFVFCFSCCHRLIFI